MNSERSVFWRILDRFGAWKWQKRGEKNAMSNYYSMESFWYLRMLLWVNERQRRAQRVGRGRMLHFYLIHLMSYKLTWMSMPLIWNFHPVTVLTMGRIVLWGGIWLWKASKTVIKNPNAPFHREMNKKKWWEVKEKRVSNSSSFF